MRAKRIPTIIGIIILVFSLGLGVFLVQFRQIFRLGATGEALPKNVRIANVGDSSFAVSWTTDKKSSGFVNFGENKNSLGQVAQDNVTPAGFTHFALLQNLKPKTQYFFKINSDGNSYDSNGSPWQATTGPIIAQKPNANLISGSVLAANGEPAKDALVYILAGGYLSSTTTSQNGSWVIQVGEARSVDLSNYLSIEPATTLLSISVDAGPQGVASAQIYPENAKPAPPITLGQTLDFRNLATGKTDGIPQATVDVADQPTTTPSSGFNIPQGAAVPSSAKTVTLSSIDEGEVITSEKPEFFGSGPSGVSLTIKVESELVSANVQIPSNGNWKWSPPTNLGEGLHKITITWKDAQGITRSLTRSFVVQAAEGPAFVSTPSATPKASPTATATASATPTAIAKIPESGSLTPTLLFSILGVGALGLSFLIWKKAYA